MSIDSIVEILHLTENPVNLHRSKIDHSQKE